MKITGELLKSERIRLKLSQQDVSFALKLSVRTVNAIEEGDLESLPAKTFVRGFVKSYAQMLKLDEESVLRQFQEEMGSTMTVTRVQVSPAETANPVKKNKELSMSSQLDEIATVNPNIKTSLNRNTFITAGVIALAVIALAIINHIVNKYQQEGAAHQTSKLTVDALNQESKVEKETSLATSETTNPTQNPGSTDTLPVSSPATQTTTTKPIDSVISAPPPVPPATTKPTEPAAAGPAAGAKPTEMGYSQKYLSATKPVELMIEAKKDISISYSIDSKNNFKTISLQKETLQIIKAKTNLYLKIDEGNAVNLTVNGINKGPASNEAKPIQLEF